MLMDMDSIGKSPKCLVKKINKIFNNLSKNFPTSLLNSNNISSVNGSDMVELLKILKN